MSQFVFEITEPQFESVIEKSHEALILVDFWAPWCGPCRNLSPILEQLADDYGGRLLVAKMNTDENQVIPGQIGIRGLPTVIFLQGGKMVNQFTGALPRSEIEPLIKALIGPASEDSVDEMVADQGPDLAERLAALELTLEKKPDAVDERLEQADILSQMGRFGDAQSAIDMVVDMEMRKGSHFDAAAARIYFDGVRSREARNDPSRQLAQAADLALSGDHEGAADCLLTLMRSNPSFEDGAAKQAILHLVAIAPDSAQTIRRRMASLLF